MEETQIERIRTCRSEILLELYHAHPLRLSTDGLKCRLKKAQYQFSPYEIERQALFLCGQGLATESTDPVSGTPVYGITSAGMLAHENSR